MGHLCLHERQLCLSVIYRQQRSRISVVGSRAQGQGPGIGPEPMTSALTPLTPPPVCALTFTERSGVQESLTEESSLVPSTVPYGNTPFLTNCRNRPRSKPALSRGLDHPCSGVRLRYSLRGPSTPPPPEHSENTYGGAALTSADDHAMVDVLPRSSQLN
eukprot:2254856-Rhodomonas_salina.2